MDDIHFASIRQRVSARLTRRSSLGFLAAAGLPLACVAEVAQAGKKKAKKVTLCVNGQTVKKPKKAAKKLQKQGATRGACNCGSGGPCFAFVTAARFTGGSLSGVAGADASCQDAASSAGLPGTYRAWLSAGSSTPGTRFSNTAGAGPYVKVSRRGNNGGPQAGPLVANSFAELLACPGGTCQAAPISDTEAGQVSQNSPVWTGTKSDGTVSPDTCNGWTNDAGQGLVGDTNLVNASWTENGTNACSESRPIFCFQQAK